MDSKQIVNKRVIKVAIITYSISHFEVPLYRLCSHDDRLSIKVFYIKKINNDESQDEGYDQIIDWGFDLISDYDSSQNLNVSVMIAAVKKWGPDVFLINGYNWPGSISLVIKNRLDRIPQVFRGTLSYLKDPRHCLKSKILSPLKCLFLHIFDTYQVGGDYSKRALVNCGVKREKMYFVPFSVDSRYFLSQSVDSKIEKDVNILLDKFGWSKNNKIVLYIAQHSWVKGPLVAINVFKKLNEYDNNIRFIVVGSGKFTKQMKIDASQMIESNYIKFCGFVPSSKTVKFYKAANITICTSLYETWARMCNESMLCGTPCVVSKNVAAAGGLISDGVNGYVVNNVDSLNFVEKILLHLSKDEKETKIMKENAINRAIEFSYEKNVENFYESIRNAYYKKKVHE